MASVKKHSEIERMFNFKNTSHFTSFHQEQAVFLDPQFNPQTSFTEKMLLLSQLKMFAKVALITVASGGFGVLMGLFMSSFEFNSTSVVDTSRSTRSQLKQHFFGYGRMLKRQALHFSKFGLYISLIELPLEIALGRVSTPAVFFSGGMASVFLDPRGGFGALFSRFMGSGFFIGGLGLYMNKGNDKG